MTIFDDVWSKVKGGVVPNAHGEVTFFKIEEGEPNLEGFTGSKPQNNQFIVGHSESGHNHVLDADGVTVMERESEGMKLLYAILENPVELKQTAGDPHKKQIVQPGKYLIPNNVDYDPFTKQARRVAD